MDRVLGFFGTWRPFSKNSCAIYMNKKTRHGILQNGYIIIRERFQHKLYNFINFFEFF